MTPAPVSSHETPIHETQTELRGADETQAASEQYAVYQVRIVHGGRYGDIACSDLVRDRIETAHLEIGAADSESWATVEAVVPVPELSCVYSPMTLLVLRLRDARSAAQNVVDRERNDPSSVDRAAAAELIADIDILIAKHQKRYARFK